MLFCFQLLFSFAIEKYAIVYGNYAMYRGYLLEIIGSCSRFVYIFLAFSTLVLTVYNPPNVHPNSAHFNNLLHVRLPPLIEVAPEVVSQMTLLGGQADEKRMNFFNNAIDAGLFFLFIYLCI